MRVSASEAPESEAEKLGANETIRRRLLPNIALSLLILCAIALSGTYAGTAQAAPKQSAIVIDAFSGKVLYSSHADAKRYPASLTKIMTLYILFEKMKKGDIELNDRVVFSRHAAGMAPSRLGIKPGRSISVESAILALVTKSANDVAAAVGEKIAGTEYEFAKLMTKTAHRLGMKNTTYKNASGLPNRYQRTTARDQATLAKRMRLDFPQYYHFFSRKYFAYNGRRYKNHNNLLTKYHYRGTTGIKTGYTRASGFNLTATIERDDRYVIAVVMGGKTSKARDRRMMGLLDRFVPRAVAWADGNTRLASAMVKNIPQPIARPVNLVSNEDRMQLASLLEEDDSADPDEETYADNTILPLPDPELASAQTEKDSGEKSLEDVKSFAVAAYRKAKGPVAKAGESLGSMLVTPAHASTGEQPRAPVVKQTAGVIAAEQNWQAGAPLIPEGTWVIQIGAYSNQSDAVQSIRRAIRAAPDQLDAAVPVTIPVRTADNRTLYRSRFGGFDGEKSASTACGRLSRQNISCVAIPPSNWSLPAGIRTARNDRG
ncbi:D-alanyl-D-alanine carboxypeptidase [Parvibaculum sp.]|jgi:D-alanyl-D-alanine carboxypeptidase|uniref:D-alanyl-D-alanine carboxypeptidase n=1 Tax=Parvibaculum sp. TaxID=2024848 RepID=UPI000C9613C0|nr:D-alanyl-D-alanine carboxypeptidase [Parvibaculum sp.]MAB13192.1 D-alanyl-D-alanine carboxypeptidase [Parvibaculum sp.]